MIELTYAKQTDIPLVKVIITEALQEYNLSFDPEGTDKDLDDIESNYFNNGGVFKVVIDPVDNKICACYALFHLTDSECELRKMYLVKNKRGQGIGSKMINDAFIEAKKLGYTRIVLETHSVLKEAVAMYKKYGFNEYEHKLCSRCNTSMYKDI